MTLGQKLYELTEPHVSRGSPFRVLDDAMKRWWESKAVEFCEFVEFCESKERLG